MVLVKPDRFETAAEIADHLKDKRTVCLLYTSRTGISKLKIGYNRVFGYYIEVSRSNAEAVPENYIRKQTLANSERYITEELKQLESLSLIHI